MHLFFALLIQFQAVGLEAGESFQQLAKMPAKSEGQALMHGRVLDAFTGRPLAGAKIETWSEEIDEFFGGYHRIGEARSRRDGRFSIQPLVDGSVEKARISAPGYLTWSGVQTDLSGVVRLFPQMKQSPRLRVLDLEGHPIAGARITTIYTCAHDIPAFDLRTGADGIAELPEFGLQEDVQDLRIRAAGFLAIKRLDGEDMFTARHLAVGRASRPYDIFLARQSPYATRILSRDGEAYSGKSVYIYDGDGYHVRRTDEGGLIEVAARYDIGEITMRTLGGPEPQYITMFFPPHGRVPTLRILAEEWPKKTKTGMLRIDLSRMSAKQEPVREIQLFHEDGWYEYGHVESDGIVFPAGKGYLVIGRAFGGYEEEIHDFELEAGKEILIRPKLTPEPTIHVQAPKQGCWTLVVQAGKDSKLEFPFDFDCHVPGNRELILYLQGEGRRIRKTVRSAVTGMKIDFAKELAAAAAEAAPEARKEPVVEQDIRFFSAKTGKALAGELSLRFGGLRFGGDCVKIPAGDKAHDRFQIRGPIGSRWLVHFKPKGHSSIFLRGQLQPGQAPLSPRVEALASLEIEAPFEFKILGDDALDLDALPPGPLGLVLLLKNGRRYGLLLDLAPGAKRFIRIR